MQENTATRLKFGLGIFLAVLGVALIIVGIIVPSSTIENATRKAIVIANTEDEDFADFTRNDNSDDPVLTDSFYIHNVTNLNEVLTGAAPAVEKVGPYVYQRHEVKHNITFTTTRLTYRTWVFYTETSILGNDINDRLDTDMLTTINFTYLGAILNVAAAAGSPFDVTSATTFLPTVSAAGLPTFELGLLPQWFLGAFLGLSQATCFASSENAIAYMFSPDGGPPVPTPASAPLCQGGLDLTFLPTATSRIAISDFRMGVALNAEATTNIQHIGLMINLGLSPAKAANEISLGAFMGGAQWVNPGLEAVNNNTYVMGFMRGYFGNLYNTVYSHFRGARGESYFATRSARAWLEGQIDSTLYLSVCLAGAQTITDPNAVLAFLMQCQQQPNVNFGFFTNYTSMVESDTYSTTGRQNRQFNNDDSDMHTYGKLVSIDGETTLQNYWEEDVPYDSWPLGRFKGEIFGEVSKTEAFVIYNSDSLRPIPTRYVADLEVRDVKVRRYEPLKSEVLNHALPENAKYNMLALGADGMLPMASYRTASPTTRLPVLLSLPNCNQCDPKFADSVLGNNPDPSQDIIYLDVEPRTGAVLRAQLSLQANLQLFPLNTHALAAAFGMPNYGALNTSVYHPVYYLNRFSQLTAQQSEDLRSSFRAADGATIGLTYIGIPVGALLLLLAAFLIIRNAKAACGTYSGVQSTEMGRA